MPLKIIDYCVNCDKRLSPSEVTKITDEDRKYHVKLCAKCAKLYAHEYEDALNMDIVSDDY